MHGCQQYLCFNLLRNRFLYSFQSCIKISNLALTGRHLGLNDALKLINFGLICILVNNLIIQYLQLRFITFLQQCLIKPLNHPVKVLHVPFELVYVRLNNR